MREHHAAFEFLGARVGAVAEVNHSALGPEVFPVGRGCIAGLGYGWGCVLRHVGEEGGGNGPLVVGRGERELVAAVLTE